MGPKCATGQSAGNPSVGSAPSPIPLGHLAGLGPHPWVPAGPLDFTPRGTAGHGCVHQVCLTFLTGANPQNAHLKVSVTSHPAPQARRSKLPPALPPCPRGPRTVLSPGRPWTRIPAGGRTQGAGRFLLLGSSVYYDCKHVSRNTCS